MKRTVESLGEIQGKTVLMRVDFNVPLEKGQITDDTRIQAAVPTIQYLLERGAKLVLCSHLGRPQKKDRSEWGKLSLKPAAERLSEILGKPVAFVGDCIGDEAEAAKAKLEAGEVLLLENTRFHRGEEKNDPEFSAALAKGCELFVEDAFGAVHRAHGSTVGVTEHLDPCVMGKLVSRELNVLDELLNRPERPFVVILGGAKVADKIGVINNLLGLADKIIIGGGMAYTFLQAAGYEIGESLLDADSLDDVREVQKAAEAKGVELLLPIDVVAVEKFAPDAQAKDVPVTNIPATWQGLDIGPGTTENYVQAVADAKMVFWNGPMGVFEFDRFAGGTNRLADKLASLDAKVVIGGGDSASAMRKAGVSDEVYHICTGGGASLEFLEGQQLPGIEAIDNA